MTHMEGRDQVAEPAAAHAGAHQATVTVRYWAGAKAATGVPTETVAAGAVGQVLAGIAARHPRTAPLLPVCAALVDGVSVGPEDLVPPGAVLDILPPFAGG